MLGKTGVNIDNPKPEDIRNVVLLLDRLTTWHSCRTTSITAMGKKPNNIPKRQRQLNEEEIAMRADAGHSGKLNSIAYEGKEEKKTTFPRKAAILR